MAKQAPDFRLTDQDGETRSLRDYKGRWLVLYFYPHDRSLNCTKQACSFRDEYRIIAQFGGAKIVGINHASVEQHKKFSEKNRLNFPILSDEGYKITKAYGAWRKLPIKALSGPFGTKRNTYIINPKGMIVKSYLRVDPSNHAEEVIKDLQKLQA